MKATIEDIAREAGVSISTVSRVLNNLSKNYRISEKTRKLVLKTAKDLRYQPNQLARGLRLRKTHTIGLVVPDIANPFFAAITDTIQSACHKLGYSLIVCNTDDKLELEVEQSQLLVSKGVDGLIVLPVGQNHDHLRRIRKEKFPLVLVDRTFDGFDAPSVVVDNFQGSFDAVSHLIHRHHTRIGIIEGLPGTFTTIERRKGYIAAHHQAGLPVDSSLMTGRSFRRETGYMETLGLLRSAAPPTAIFATSDLITLGALQAIDELGLRVPDDISLVAFDEIDFNDFLRCPLTLVAQPKEQLGEVSVSMVMREIAGSEGEAQQVVLRPTLNVRRSVRDMRPLKRTLVASSVS